MPHHQSRLSLAPGAHLDDLAQRFDDACRIVRNGVSVMTEQESQLLSDFARGRNLVTLGKLLNVAQRAGNDADALVIAEAIRGYVLARRATRSDVLCVLAAFQDETAANGPADEAQLQFLYTPSRATRDSAIEALSWQEVTTRRAIDALHTTDISSTTRLLRVG